MTKPDHTDRRTFLAGAAALGVGWVLAGCGNDDDGAAGQTDAEIGTDRDTASTGSSPSQPAANTTGEPAPGDAFPRTVEGADGPVVIEAAPERVWVFRNFAELDAMLSLGVVPHAYGENPTRGLQPWQVDALAEIGGEIIGVSTDEEVNAERLAELDLDLFVVPDRNLGDEEVEIYATVGQQTGAPVLFIPQDRREVIRVLGDALGREDRAAAAIAEYDAKIAAFTVPATAGSYAVLQATEDGQIYVWGRGSKTMTETLMEYGLPEPLTPSGAGPDDLGALVSLELVEEELGDADHLILLDFGDTGDGISDEWAALLDDPVFQQLDAVSAGHVTRVDEDTAYSIIFPSLLSVDTALAALTEAFST